MSNVSCCKREQTFPPYYRTCSEFYAGTLLLEEGYKRLDLNKSYGYTLPECFNGTAMYENLCHVAIKHDKPAKGKAKSETQIMNAFGKKNYFDFKVSLVEQTIPSQSIGWKHWTGNGNSGKDAVAQANDIDKTQLSNGHRKQPKKRVWKIEHISNLLHERDEKAQLSVIAIRDNTFGLDDFRDNLIMANTRMCSLKVPTTAIWSNGSCNGAAPFKTMWTQYGFFR